jgi:hypothetical protein
MVRGDKRFLGKIDNVALYWIALDDKFRPGMGLFRMITREEDVAFFCSPMGCDTEEGGEEDDFPFIMDLVTARALFDFLKSRGVRWLSKLAYGEYMAFYGEDGMRSSVVETSAAEVLSGQMRELSEELRKANREHKTEKD